MDYEHRDGITITGAEVIKTTRTIKIDGRGWTNCDEIVIGYADCVVNRGPEPFAFSDRGHVTEYRQANKRENLFVIAFPQDIHHRGMTETEALAFGEQWLAMVRGVVAANKRREEWEAKRPERMAARAAHNAREQAGIAPYLAEGLTLREALEKYYPKMNTWGRET